MDTKDIVAESEKPMETQEIVSEQEKPMKTKETPAEVEENPESNKKRKMCNLIFMGIKFMLALELYVFLMNMIIQKKLQKE